MPKDTALFRCHLPAKRFKEIVASAQAIGETMSLQMNSAEGERHLVYWATDDPKPRIAMVGQANDSLFHAMQGNDEQHIIQAPAKLLAQCIAAFDLKHLVEVSLFVEDNKYLLRLSQAKDDDSEPDTRTITVAASDGRPTQPVLAKSAYAAVDLKRFGKVLNGLKQNTDVVTVGIRPDEFEVSASTKRLQDGWKHAGTASGKATGLYSAALLRKIIQGAVQISEFGEVHLADDNPFHVQAVDEDLTAHFYVAGREMMR